MKSKVKIGGEGEVVEIDETVLSKRKYGRGHFVKEQWIFGGIQRGTTKCFLKKVDHRDAKTLLPIIEEFIEPGTTIISDKWAAYNGITKLGKGYKHLTVNHSENFKDPETGAHTNSIESTWQKFKQDHKKRYGTDRDLLPTYIAQFVWRREFKDAPFYHFWKQVSELYPVERSLQQEDREQDATEDRDGSSGDETPRKRMKRELLETNN